MANIDFSVRLDPSFQNGTLDGAMFKDFHQLDPYQQRHIADFISGVSNHEKMPGKNKESWLDDNLNVLPDTSAYQTGNYWHYHCGPYNGQTNYNFTVDLKSNASGLTSPAVIHYRKIDKNEIVIVGYSPKHLPFPNSDTSNNPLFSDDD